MNQNKYDENDFFEKYKEMDRSKKGLQSAGEWHEFKKALPSFDKKRVLDLGCGFGWHCQYAIEHGADAVVGVDISQKMLEQAKKLSNPQIKYLCTALEDIEFADGSFDVIISSLTFHYIKSWENIVEKMHRFLASHGTLLFSVEHPIFTAQGPEEWIRDEKGEILHWPVDNYFNEGLRNTNFLGEKVIKYHRTLTTYLSTLLNLGFEIEKVVEPQPSNELLVNNEIMKNELRRPMMIIIRAQKM